MSIDLTKAMAEFDKDMIAGLKGAGLALRTGEDGFGLADHQLIKGGLYYIDHGANSLIIDGRIKIHHCEEGVASFGEKAEAIRRRVRRQASRIWGLGSRTGASRMVACNRDPWLLVHDGQFLMVPAVLEPAGVADCSRH
jgi:hypothetical protein